MHILRIYFKRRLLRNYSDELVISSEDIKSDVATLKLLVNTILRKHYGAPKDIDINLQEIVLLTTAAKLIKTDIKLINTNPKFYSSLEFLEQSASSSFLPSSLHYFFITL